MIYTPTSVVTIVRDRLSETPDLSKPLSYFIGKKAYLVVTKNAVKYPLSIARIVTFLPKINLATAIGTVFNTLLNDTFVNRFHSPSVPTTSAQGSYQKRLNVFNPVALDDFDVYFTSINTPEIKNDASKRGFLDDLAITSRKDMSCYLVAVNGVFHRTVISDGILYVLDGFRTVRLTGRKDVTVVDTKHLGGHTIIPLTPSNVTQNGYNQSATVTLPDSVAGKTIFLVIDGYFYHKDHKVFNVADNKHLKILTHKLPLIQQFRHNPRTIHKLDRYGPDASQASRKYTDAYAAMFLDQSSVPTSDLANVAFQYSRLTTYHSFLVVVNNPNIYTITTDVIPSGTPQLYEDHSKRIVSGMMHYGCGLCPSYLIWKDPSERKSIFIGQQDNDVDWQNQTLNPAFIPTLISDPIAAAKAPAQFFDYVSA